MKYEKEIISTAVRFKVESNWIKAIIKQESGGEQYALRYESAYNYLYKADEIARKFGITLNTEIQTQKMSWGLGQIMGAVAREQGHIGHMGELFDPLVNIIHIAHRLSTIMKYSEDPKDVFAIYNGGVGAWHEFQKNGKYPNQSYVDSAIKHLQDVEKGVL